eukprot:5057076-Pyramimonas_sp.AAC.2
MSTSEEDERRREALRKAGQDYFEQVLKQASKGKDPFKSAQPSATGRAPPKILQMPAELDAELMAVGSALDKTKAILVLVTFLSCASSAMIFSKVRVERRCFTPLVGKLTTLQSTKCRERLSDGADESDVRYSHDVAGNPSGTRDDPRSSHGPDRNFGVSDDVHRHVGVPTHDAEGADAMKMKNYGSLRAHSHLVAIGSQILIFTCRPRDIPKDRSHAP